MFQLGFFNARHNEEGNIVDAMAIMRSNFNKDTGLHTKNTTIEGMITKSVLNEILHHVGMLLIICSNHEVFY